jgi:hypothetical protein
VSYGGLLLLADGLSMAVRGGSSGEAIERLGLSTGRSGRGGGVLASSRAREGVLASISGGTMLLSLFIDRIHPGAHWFS